MVLKTEAEELKVQQRHMAATQATVVPACVHVRRTRQYSVPTSTCTNLASHVLLYNHTSVRPSLFQKAENIQFL